MPKPRIAAGELRWQVQLMQPNLTQDSSGGVDPTATSVFATVWAKIEALMGRELYAAQQRVSEVTHRLTIRYLRGVTSQMDLWFNDPGTGNIRVFRILDVLNPDETPHLLWLLCMERDAGDAQAGGGRGAPVALTPPISISNPVVFTATGTSNTFTLPAAPARGIMLFLNGELQISPGDYALSGADIVMTRTPEDGDVLVAFFL